MIAAGFVRFARRNFAHAARVGDVREASNSRWSRTVTR
jgi:hypothetical protein